MIAAAGLRLCVEELSSVEAPKLASGKDGKPRVAYADLADSERWMGKFILCRAAGYAESALGGPRLGCYTGWRC
jgi:hypothetical protein